MCFANALFYTQQCHDQNALQYIFCRHQKLLNMNKTSKCMHVLNVGTPTWDDVERKVILVSAIIFRFCVFYVSLKMAATLAKSEDQTCGSVCIHAAFLLDVEIHIMIMLLHTTK